MEIYCVIACHIVVWLCLVCGLIMKDWDLVAGILLIWAGFMWAVLLTIDQ